MRSKWSEEKIERWIRDGRGQGEGAHYKPWLTVNDLSSQGRCHRIWSEKFGRTLQLFSDIEKAVFLSVERSSSVKMVLEQYPILDREVSKTLAASRGIRHPVYPGTNVPIVLTIDFMLRVQTPTGLIGVGIDAKPRERAEDARSIEKLELSRACLAKYGYRHLVVFDTQFPKLLTNNLEWVRAARPHAAEVLPYPGFLDEAVAHLHAHLETLVFGERPLRVVCQEFDDMRGQQAGTALRAARLMIDRSLLTIDLNRKNLASLPMKEFSLPRDSKTYRTAELL